MKESNIFIQKANKEEKTIFYLIWTKKNIGNSNKLKEKDLDNNKNKNIRSRTILVPMTNYSKEKLFFKYFNTSFI